jgi:hypothetical protein
MLAGLMNAEAAGALLQGSCSPEAEEIRTRFVANAFSPGATNPAEWSVASRAKLDSFKPMVCAKMADHAKLMVRAGRTEDAARLFSRALSLSWERAAADALAELLADRPELPAELYLTPFRQQFENMSASVPAFHRLYARALQGDVSALAEAIARPLGESMFRLGNTSFSERHTW